MRLPGFTLLEVMLVTAMILVSAALLGTNLVGSRSRTSSSTTVSVLEANIKHTQVKAMLSDAGGDPAAAPQGIRFETDRYYLFYGPVFSSSDPKNFMVLLESGLSFSDIGFPASSLVFSRGSGEVAGYVSGQDYVTLANQTDGSQTTLRINQYGVFEP